MEGGNFEEAGAEAEEGAEGGGVATGEAVPGPRAPPTTPLPVRPEPPGPRVPRPPAHLLTDTTAVTRGLAMSRRRGREGTSMQAGVERSGMRWVWAQGDAARSTTAPASRADTTSTSPIILTQPIPSPPLSALIFNISNNQI